MPWWLGATRGVNRHRTSSTVSVIAIIFFVERQRARHGAPQLCHLQRMGEPGTKQVALVVKKNLRFVHQPPKRRAVNDAIAVALEFGACRR